MQSKYKILFLGKIYIKNLAYTYLGTIFKIFNVEYFKERTNWKHRILVTFSIFITLGNILNCNIMYINV